MEINFIVGSNILGVHDILFSKVVENKLKVARFSAKFSKFLYWKHALPIRIDLRANSSTSLAYILPKKVVYKSRSRSDLRVKTAQSSMLPLPIVLFEHSGLKTFQLDLC